MPYSLIPFSVFATDSCNQERIRAEIIADIVKTVTETNDINTDIEEMGNAYVVGKQR